MIASAADQFEILSGPEDGMIFPVTRVPLDIGADPACPVHLRFDQAVEPVHARVTVVSEGYRVRAMGPGRLLVNGRRAGFIQSRIVRHGGTVKVGETELVLLVAPEGLARRSHGMPQESDLAWALRAGSRQLYRVLRALFRFTLAAAQSLNFFVTLLIVGGLVLFFQPWLWPWLKFAAQWLWYRAWEFGAWVQAL